MADAATEGMTGAKRFYEGNARAMRPVREGMPEAIQGFVGLHHAAMKPGELATREKELIALGISIAVRCEPCIYSHVQAAAKAGATRAMILETAAVSLMMAGGPGYTYMPRVVEALEALGME
jgi:AhpD family alkylhydroperoxidase